VTVRKQKVVVERYSLRVCARRISAAFAIPLIDVGDAIFIKRRPWYYDQEDGRRDLTALEADINVLQVDRLFAGVTVPRRDKVDVGREIARVWGERLRALLGERRVRFYITLGDRVSLRFHTLREFEPPWCDPPSAQVSAEIEIYEATQFGFERVF
jgi:hypothetical protein